MSAVPSKPTTGYAVVEDATLEASDTMTTEQIAQGLGLNVYIVAGMVSTAAHRAHAARLGLPDNR